MRNFVKVITFLNAEMNIQSATHNVLMIGVKVNLIQLLNGKMLPKTVKHYAKYSVVLLTGTSK
jgi:hypothetical protein